MARYPTDIRLVYALANTLFAKWSATGKGELLDEIIDGCELILRNSLDDEMRYSAIQLLVYTYGAKGDKEKASALATRIPSYINEEILLVSILDGEEKRFQTFFEGGDYLFYHNRLAHLYLNRAELKVQIGDDDGAMDDLIRAGTSAIAYERLPQEVQYTSRCFNLVTHDLRKASKNYAETEPELPLKAMEKSRFDPIRSRPGVLELQRELTQHVLIGF